MSNAPENHHLIELSTHHGTYRWISLYWLVKKWVIPRCFSREFFVNFSWNKCEDDWKKGELWHTIHGLLLIFFTWKNYLSRSRWPSLWEYSLLCLPILMVQVLHLELGLQKLVAPTLDQSLLDLLLLEAAIQDQQTPEAPTLVPLLRVQLRLVVPILEVRIQVLLRQVLRVLDLPIQVQLQLESCVVVVISWRISPLERHI